MYVYACTEKYIIIVQINEYCSYMKIPLRSISLLASGDLLENLSTAKHTQNFSFCSDQSACDALSNAGSRPPGHWAGIDWNFSP